MASFVFHNIVGERIINILEIIYNINYTKEEKYNFLLGNLIVDSTKIKTKTTKIDNQDTLDNLIQNEKITTHFRDINDYNLVIQVPIIERFIKKYQNLLGNDISALGYLLHLYTDKMFFGELFVISFEMLDINMQPTLYNSKAKWVKVKKNNKVYPVDDFWNHYNENSIYNDYTNINQILIKKFGCSFNAKELLEHKVLFQNPGIDEVDYSDIESIIKDTDAFIKASYQKDNTTLNIFDEKIIIKFIDIIAYSFIEKYYYLFKKNALKNRRKK